MSIIRDILRRKGRSVLTITGIAIGVFALVVLGSFAENDNVYIARLATYYAKTIVVTEEKDANMFGLANGVRPLSMKTVDKLAAHAGVSSVGPQVTLLLKDTYTSVIPPMILGYEPTAGDYGAFSVSEGRMLKGGENKVAVVGSDLASQLKLKVGDITTARGMRFTVVGILARTYVNLLDASLFIDLGDAQKLYVATLPESVRTTIDTDTVVTQVNVYAKTGTDPDRLASDLTRDIKGIHTTGPTTMRKTVDGLVGLINAAVGAVALLAFIICSLSIVNTMSMSVGERTREIGIKRALGASRGRVARDVLAESALIGLIGGLVGLAFGALVANGMNAGMVAATGTTAFLLTWRLSALALVFALVMGTAGGLYPARHAARLDPSTALAHE